MSKKVLIVDDEPSIIVALQFLMEQNGYETLVAFSGEEAKDIRIVLVTALGSEANAAKGLALGADAYITKPFANADLVAKVKELLACPV
jgi:DNA-binding response OmpR family regulator